MKQALEIDSSFHLGARYQGSGLPMDCTVQGLAGSQAEEKGARTAEHLVEER